MCEKCGNVRLRSSISSNEEYLDCLQYVQFLVDGGDFKFMEKDCDVDKVKNADGHYVADSLRHAIKCKTCGQCFVCSADTFRGEGSFRIATEEEQTELLRVENERRRPICKIFFLWLYTLAFLCCSAGVTFLSGLIPFPSPPIVVAVTIVCLGGNIALTVFCKERTYFQTLCFSACLNCITLGFSIRAVYGLLGWNDSFSTLLFVALAASAVPIVFYTISLLSLVNDRYVAFFWTLSALMPVCYVAALIWHRAAYLLPFGFYMVFAWVMVLCMPDDPKGEKLYRILIYATFNVWLIIVTFILWLCRAESGPINLSSSDSPQDKREK